MARVLNEIGVDWSYEKTKLNYTVPESEHTYTVDFTVGNLLLEGKGILSDVTERRKYELIKKQHILIFFSVC